MKNRTAIITLLFLLFIIKPGFSQSLKVDKIEPPNWWSGMKYNRIQLMVYGQNLNDVSARFNSPLLRILGVHKTDNPSYAFIDVEVSSQLKPGSYILTLGKGREKLNVNYSILQRRDPKGCFQGFKTSDVIYMITPDRFANGDTSNDFIKGMNDNFSRASNLGRHGGDIEGIIDHLDYLKDLGITALWSNPLVENNQKLSYHGYAATDLYKIDPRFGTNELYVKMVTEAHSRGIKIILDHVNNHIGINHPWIKNLPVKDWLNGTPENHSRTNHINNVYYDIHGSSEVRSLDNQGWFVDEMPDLNQTNPYVAKYLIQNTLWWIESTGLDGIREDTYPYSDQKYLSLWNETVLREYPGFNIVGEIWMGDAAFTAPFQAASILHKEFDTHLPSLMDFPLSDIVREVFGDSTKRMRPIYDALAKDYLYANPSNLVTFLDNHDMQRILYIVKNDLKKLKLSLTLLLTMRGIPQIYYGTEIGILGGADHGAIRADFPGGFSGSSHNTFNKQGRTETENEIFEFTKQLIRIRLHNKALTEGSLIHFPPEGELYPYLRIADNQKILVLLNNKNKNQQLKLQVLGQYIKDAKTLKNLRSGEELQITDGFILEIPAMDGVIYQVE